MAYPIPNYSLAVMAKTALQFFEQNTVLADKQIGQETDTWRFKLGDGVTPWNTLGYAVLGNEQSVWAGLSPDAGNLLELTVARAGFFLSPTTFDGRSLVNQATDGSVTDITPYLTANQQLAGFVAAGLMIRKIIQSLGTGWALTSGGAVPATTVTQAIANVVSSVSSLSGTVGGLINDTTPGSSTTFSSNKINTLVTTAIGNIVGAAPEALDTVYELAAALGNNPNLVTNIVTELGQTVKVTAQSLTGPQQTQVRTNIGAASAADLGNPAENALSLSARYLAIKSAASGAIDLEYIPNPLPMVKSTAFVAKPKSDGTEHQEGIYFLDTSAASFTTQMPANPTQGQEVEFLDYASSFDTNPAQLDRNGQKFMGLEENYFLNQKNMGRTFIFSGPTKGWMPKA